MMTTEQTDFDFANARLLACGGDVDFFQRQRHFDEFLAVGHEDTHSLARD